jgi:hypothetical protein
LVIRGRSTAQACLPHPLQAAGIEFEPVIPTRVVADSDVIWSGSRVPDSVPV